LRCQCWEGKEEGKGGSERRREVGREIGREVGRRKDIKQGGMPKGLLSNPNKSYLILHKAENNAVSRKQCRQVRQYFGLRQEDIQFQKTHC